jgi:hypothetical protein
MRCTSLDEIVLVSKDVRLQGYSRRWGSAKLQNYEQANVSSFQETTA